MKKQQAKAPDTVPYGREAFKAGKGTTVRWLGCAGAHINCRGTNILIDPLLDGYGLPLLVKAPIQVEDIPHVDAVLITHSDTDHFSRTTCLRLRDVCCEYHSTRYVAELMGEMSLSGQGHDIGETFSIGSVKVTLTPADHAWQNGTPMAGGRVFRKEDYCGFWVDTPDGSIWAVGDSRLMDEHLHMPEPDLMLFDFSDNEWHIGLKNAARLANTYPRTPLLLWHWGCVDAPDMTPFNGDPEELKALIRNPERALVMAPGEPLELRRI